MQLLDIKEVGTVREVKFGIVKIDGLPNCIYGQLLQFPRGIKGMVIGYTAKEVAGIVLGEETSLSVGDPVSTLAELISVPVGNAFVGRVVGALAQPLDGRGPIESQGERPVFFEAPGIMERIPLSEPLETGVKIVDMVIPVGKGQRQLIIGDRQTGKSAIGLDAIINQKGKNVICIYCWIGGPQNALKKHIHILGVNGAFDHTLVVSAPANASAAEQYLVPYTAAALGEYFVSQGRDVLVVFDDLTKHAWVYRQMSLLLERSPGREAYPGDIFYLHSQLLERAGRFAQSQGGGTMTFLPIVETLQGDIAGYVQSNLVSITDGQLYINAALFKEGFKPAIDMGLSVSRIGSKVQSSAVRAVSGGLRLEYAQYRDMLRLTKLRTRLSQEAMDRMRKGEVLTQLLMQTNMAPVPHETEVLLFYAFKRNVLDIVPSETRAQFITDFAEFFERTEPQGFSQLKSDKKLLPTVTDAIDRALRAYFRAVKDAAPSEAKVA
jgi:F-type H+-transporting ATPase subunit alpha